MNQQALATLRTCRDSLNESLLRNAEYRALVAIDKTILEISQIAASEPAPEPRDDPAQPTRAQRDEPHRDEDVAPGAAQAPDNLPVAPAQAVRAPNRLALAIAESIEANVSTLKPQRPPNPGLHHLFRTVS